MKLSHLIMGGVLLLSAGIILKVIGIQSPLPLIFIGSGVALKLTYMGISIQRNIYQPAQELVLLVVGLFLLFTGIYLRKQGVQIGLLIEIVAILMKTIFVLIFIRKTRQNRP